MPGVFSISQKIFGHVMPTAEKTEPSVNVNRLLREARKLADTAEEELRHGTEAILLGARHRNRQFNLIAEWHFRRSKIQSQLAQEKLSAAQSCGLRGLRSEYCRAKSRQMDELNARCGELLRRLSRKNETGAAKN